MCRMKTHFSDPMAYYNIACFLRDYIDDNTIIVCIGTDRCIGDCLGPLVGTFLKENSFPLPVYGTISSPIHALNLDVKIKEITDIHPNAKIIGIDACLGHTSNIGEIQCRNSPINPGKGVGKDLPAVGDLSIIGIVDSSDDSEPFATRNIRLDLIFRISRTIAKGILHGYFLNDPE